MRRWVAITGLFIAGVSSCGDDEKKEETTADRGLYETTGAECSAAADCFPDVEVQGDALCLDRVRDGYCTHECTSDDECCAVDGECTGNTAQVCAPFESTGGMLCFLSCEKATREATATKYDDDNAFCQGEVSPQFICRSSGGGSNNRKICVPGDCGVGAACLTDDDCPGDLDCLDGFDGGYCGTEGCEGDDDCSNGSVCVVNGKRNVCMKQCSADSECTFCRSGDAHCTDDVEYVESGGGPSVCVVD